MDFTKTFFMTEGVLGIIYRKNSYYIPPQCLDSNKGSCCLLRYSAEVQSRPDSRILTEFP